MENTPQNVLTALRNLQRLMTLPTHYTFSQLPTVVGYRCFIEDETFVIDGYLMHRTQDEGLTHIAPQKALYVPYGRRVWVAANQFVFNEFAQNSNGAKAYEKAYGGFSMFMTGQQALAIEEFWVNLEAPVVSMTINIEHMESLCSRINAAQAQTTVRLVLPEVDDPVVAGLKSA
jgi:hypothetical protein